MPLSDGTKFRIYQTLPAVLFVLLWELSVSGRRELAFFFGQPSQILFYLINRFADGSIIVDFLVTATETVLGFLIGNIGGTVIGLSLWYSKTAFRLSRPYIIAFGSAPVFALAPLLIIWFGTGMFSKVMIAGFSTVFIALFQAYTGAAEVDEEYLRLLKSFGARKSQMFRKVIAPSAIVWVITAFKINVGFAILGAFIGEFISSNRGLGHLILVASGLFDISLVLCGVLLLICIALILTYCVSRIEAPLKVLIVRYL